MARSRPKLSDTLVDLLIKLPPWLSLAIGIACYAVMEWYQRTHVAPNVEWMMSAVTSMYPPIALAFFVALAAGSAVHRIRRERLVDQQTGLDSLRHTPWKEFEYLVAEAFRRLGYSADYSMDHGPDGGVDITLKKEGLTSLVQCKRWRSGSVGVAVAREMLGILHAKKAHEVFIVTTGGFTAEAKSFARTNPIKLIDGAKLWKMVAEVQAKPGTAPVMPAEISAATTPECPKCGGEMVRRIAKRGPSAGSVFWSCARFPDCYGNASIHGQPETA